MAEIEKIKAKIEEARIEKISDIWRRKPGTLRFNETEALVVIARAGDQMIIDTFYFCLKSDGTFDVDIAGVGHAGSRARRARLVSFLRYYGIVDESGDCNLAEAVKTWVGKSVEVVLFKDGGCIYVP